MLEVGKSKDGKRVIVGIACDLCGEPINRDQTGILMYRVEEEGPSGRLFFLHNGEKRCTRRYEQMYPGNWGWAPSYLIPKWVTAALAQKGGA